MDSKERELMEKRILDGEEIITGEMIIEGIKEFRDRFSAIGEDIRYQRDGVDLSLPDFVDEMLSDSEIGKKTKRSLIQMALYEFLNIVDID